MDRFVGCRARKRTLNTLDAVRHSVECYAHAHVCVPPAVADSDDAQFPSTSLIVFPADSADARVCSVMWISPDAVVAAAAAAAVDQIRCQVVLLSVLLYK